LIKKVLLKKSDRLKFLMAEVKMEASWKEQLKEEFEKPYFNNLIEFVKLEYANNKVFPPAGKIFAAFDHCPFEKVKVVILGQDPYHGEGQAHGLSFSVPEGIAIPPSLRNIFKEIKEDIGNEIPKSGNLERWADQGILLLNATLTVRAGEAGSHQKKGWEIFTDAVIKKLSDKKENIVFLLWGAYAQKKGEIIDENKHYILKAKHPSPLAVKYGGFFGTKHFSKTNIFLKNKGEGEINW